MSQIGAELLRLIPRSDRGGHREPPLRFREFVPLFFPVADPSAAFVANWHIDLIADELGLLAHRVRAGEALDLVVCVPPSSTKSLLASVLWPAWIWTWWPEARVITATYEAGLSRGHSRRSRAVVDSEEYQRRWPVRITKATESEWENEAGGTRVATATGSTITGKHAHIHVYDDLVKEQDSRLGTAQQIGRVLETARSFVSTTMATRRVSPALGRVLVGQRLHRRDPPGWALGEGWRGIVLPARAVGAKGSPGRHPEDKREEGEPLCPPRMDAEAIEALAVQLGPRAASAQLQQSPGDAEGALLRPEYLGHRYRVLPAELQQALLAGRPGTGQLWLTAWDLTFKGKSTSDWVVGQVWCAYRARYYLIDQVRARLGFGQTKAAVLDLAHRYPICQRHLVEDAANAAAVEDDLRAVLPGLTLEPHGGGCLVRTQLIEGLWAAGNVLLPESAPWLGGSDGFVAEHEAFEGSDADTDDQVSASSLALLHMHSRGMLPAWARIAAAARERGTP